MDEAKDANTYFYPVLLNREGFIKWFRKNFYNLKNNPDGKNYILFYYKCLSPAERSNDMIIHIIEEYEGKSKEMDKEIANYKNIIDSYKHKNSDLEKVNNQLKYILAGMRSIVSDDIEKTHSFFKTKAGQQAESLRNAYQFLLYNVNNRTFDIKSCLNNVSSQVNLILDDKWITEFFEQCKKWACNNINDLYSIVDEQTLSEINSHQFKKIIKMSVSKTSTSSADIRGHGNNYISSRVIMKPVRKARVKSTNEISHIATEESENDTDPFKISRQSIKKDFIYNIPQFDSQPKKSEDRSNMGDAQKGTDYKPVEKVDKTPISGSSESAIDANKKIASDDNQESPQEIEQEEFELVIDMFYSKKKGPVAESNKKLPEKSTKKEDYKSTVNQDEIEVKPKQSSKEVKIIERSSTESKYPVKKLQETKSELLDESLTMTTFKKLAPVAESTKKNDINSSNELIIESDFAETIAKFLKK